MRVLYVAPTDPLGASYGAAQRTHLLYRALCEMAAVDVLVLNEWDASPPPNALGFLPLPARAWHQRYTAVPEAQRWCAEQLEIKDYDLVVGRYVSRMAALGNLSHVPTIVDADDAYYRYARPGTSVATHTRDHIKTAARRWLSARALQRFDHAWFCSPHEQAMFKLPSSSVLPNIPNVHTLDQPSPTAKAPRLLFVGSLWYEPNQRAVQWLLDQCWSAVRRRVPDAVLRVVGACPDSRRAAWMQRPGVECPGFVDDLATEYQLARSTIAPIWSGGGTQIKVLESYAYGRPCIISEFVYTGLRSWLHSGESVLVSADAAETIQHCVELLSNRGKADQLAAAGASSIRSELSWDNFQSCVSETVKCVLARRSEPSVSAREQRLP